MRSSDTTRTGKLFVTAAFAVALAYAHAAEAATPDADLLRTVKRNADISTVRSLLKQGADANARFPDGATPLLWAAQWDNVATVRALLGAGGTVDAANDYGVTPLAMACTNGSAAMVNVLLEAGADANRADPSGVRPLMIAARVGNVDVVKALLAHGADIGATEAVLGQNALTWAVSERQIDVVRTLLEAGATPRVKSRSGFTPLLFAARQGDIALARLLVAHGADVNESSTAGLSPLHVATVRGHVPMAVLLLESGANPNAGGPGYTALHWAVWRAETALTSDYAFEEGEWSAMAGLPDRPAKLAFIKMLLEKGADVNAGTTAALPSYGGIARQMGGGGYAGATPFFLAAHVADVEIMRLLLAHGANPLAGTKDGSMPLMVAAGLATAEDETRTPQASRVEAAKLCLEVGNKIDAANASGRTALHGSARIGLDQVITLLAGRGANLQPKDQKGVTPMKLAEADVVTTGMMARYHPATARLLRDLGATE